MDVENNQWPDHVDEMRSITIYTPTASAWLLRVLTGCEEDEGEPDDGRDVEPIVGQIAGTGR